MDMEKSMHLTVSTCLLHLPSLCSRLVFIPRDMEAKTAFVVLNKTKKLSTKLEKYFSIFNIMIRSNMMISTHLLTGLTMHPLIYIIRETAVAEEQLWLR